MFFDRPPLTTEDRERIYQALAFEARRLNGLGPGWRTQESVDHAVALRERFAKSLRADGLDID